MTFEYWPGFSNPILNDRAFGGLRDAVLSDAEERRMTERRSGRFGCQAGWKRCHELRAGALSPAVSGGGPAEERNVSDQR